MSSPANSKVRAKVWMTPDQVEALRSACYTTGAEYLQQPDEAIIAFMYDTGLRVGELIQIEKTLLRNGNSELYLSVRRESLREGTLRHTGVFAATCNEFS